VNAAFAISCNVHHFAITMQQDAEQEVASWNHLLCYLLTSLIVCKKELLEDTGVSTLLAGAPL